MTRNLAGLGLGAALALVLTGCIGHSALDDLKNAQASGSGFDRALFKYYSFLATSFGPVDAPPGTTFDQEGSTSFGDTDYTVSGVADSFARKALDTSTGMDVLPEPAPNTEGENLRNRLMQALIRGRDQSPDAAARAQADYDCWALDGRVKSLQPASTECRRSLDTTLTRLENIVQQQNLPPAAAPPSLPVTPPATPPAASSDHP